MEWTDKKLERPIRVVYQVIERTVEADGQILLVPKIEVQVFFTTLRCPPWQVIKLFRDHATSEQFHSELKTDYLNLERLPSGKVATNDLVLCTGLVAYNLLRAIGQISIQEPDAPLRKTQSMVSDIPAYLRDVVGIKCHEPMFPFKLCTWEALFRDVFLKRIESPPLLSKPFVTSDSPGSLIRIPFTDSGHPVEVKVLFELHVITRKWNRL